MKGVYIFLAPGFEDVEAIATADALRRGNVNVKLVSLSDQPMVSSSHDVTVGTDMTYEEWLETAPNGNPSPEDVLIFPGGMPGTKNLAAHRGLMALMREHYELGGTVAAICAAPGLVLSQLGSNVAGHEMTCFDGFEDTLKELGATFVPKPAITSGRIITGRSAGHAFAFGLEILRKVKGPEAAAKAAHGIMLEVI